MTLPSKADFLNVGFTERQSDVLVEIFRAIRRARFFYLQFFSYAACCSLLIVFLFILHSCYQLNSIQRHVQTNQTLIRGFRFRPLPRRPGPPHGHQRPDPSTARDRTNRPASLI